MKQSVISLGLRAIIRRRVYGMKGCGYGAGALLQLLLSAILCAASANRPPVVNAGPDRDSVRINHRVFLAATVEDDSTPLENLSLLWTQVSGPAVSEILSPDSRITRVIFPRTGVYAFSLRASDGKLTGIDTVKISVIDSIAFLILAPKNNGEITIGMPYVIRWQIDQNKACDVYYSLDSGISWVELTTQGSYYDSFVWNVDSSFVDSNRYGLLKVEEYQTPTYYTTTAFILVDGKNGIRHEGGMKGIRSLRPDINARGMVRIYETNTVLFGRDLVYYDVRGRRLFNAPQGTGESAAYRIGAALVGISP